MFLFSKVLKKLKLQVLIFPTKFIPNIKRIMLLQQQHKKIIKRNEKDLINAKTTIEKLDTEKNFLLFFSCFRAIPHSTGLN